MYLIVFIVLFFSISNVLSWSQRNEWGKCAFLSSPVRFNFMPLWVPFAVFGVWVLSMSAVAKILEIYFGFSCCQDNLLGNQISLAISSIVTALLSLNLAKIFFAEGLNGFGLDISTIKADLKRAAWVLLRVFPIIWVVMVFINTIVPLITNGEIEIPSHPLLEYAATANKWEIALIAFLAVVIAPVLEEILFRGFVQTKIYDNLENRWAAIIAASLFFAAVHGGSLWTHWPALFLFSCALGYVYEKSGSLWQPLFMHSMFNAVNMLLSFALEQPPTG